MLTAAKTIRFSLCIAACGALLAGTLALAVDTTLEGIAVDPPEQGEPSRDPPVLVMSFHDPIDHHCMGLTSDGSYYYTINGGNATWGEIRTYDLSGNPVNVVSCAIDARTILYNPADGEVYAKGFNRNWYRVYPETGNFEVVFTGIFQYSQSSPTLTPDGLYILEHESGTIHWIDASTGQVVDTQYGFYYGSSPSNEGLTTDGCRLFTWDGTLTYVYDMMGVEIESWNVPQGHYGFSPSFANGLFWTSDDSADMWYGYDVGSSPSPVEAKTWGTIKSLYR